MTYIPTQSEMMPMSSWAEFLAVVSDKELEGRINYYETDQYYDIRTQDSFIWQVFVFKGTADATDFENNWKSQCNGASKSLCTVLTGHEWVRIQVGGVSPDAPGPVALPKVAIPSDLRDIKVEATLATTDGTPTGGTLMVALQTSVDGLVSEDWTDWLHFVADPIPDDTPAKRYRFAAGSGPTTPSEVGWDGAPDVASPSVGEPENWVRTVFFAGPGTTHGVDQSIYVIGRLPK
jgi:NADH:ubiquinone oxidoreductase subunit